MPKFDKPDSPNIIWGVNALEEDLTRPSDSKIQTGWIQEKPPYEFENYSMNKLYQGFAYYNQLGFPEWDSVTEYQAGKSYVQGSDNRVYKCIQTHNNRNPATSGNEAYWEVFEGNRQATSTKRGSVELATDQEVLDGISSTLAVTPSNLFSSILASVNLSGEGSLSIPVNSAGNRRLLIMQWGLSQSSSSINQLLTTSFNTGFPNACLHVSVGTKSSDSSGGAQQMAQLISFNNSSYTWFCDSLETTGQQPIQSTYFAIGW